jgi:hypothetical protein
LAPGTAPVSLDFGNSDLNSRALDGFITMASLRRVGERNLFPSSNSFWSAYGNLAEKWGTFPALISLEVVEHVYDPFLWAADRVFSSSSPVAS